MNLKLSLLLLSILFVTVLQSDSIEIIDYYDKIDGIVEMPVTKVLSIKLDENKSSLSILENIGMFIMIFIQILTFSYFFRREGLKVG